MSRNLVCVCNMVTENEILITLRKGAISIIDIQKTTNAGTSCGKCLMTIDRIVEDFIEQQPVNLQQRIDFGESH